jgi:hypothetical protein
MTSPYTVDNTSSVFIEEDNGKAETAPDSV